VKVDDWKRDTSTTLDRIQEFTKRYWATNLRALIKVAADDPVVIRRGVPTHFVGWRVFRPSRACGSSSFCLPLLFQHNTP